MSSIGSSRALAITARKTYLETLLRGASGLIHACANGAKLLASQTAEPGLYMRRRDLVLDMPMCLDAWQRGLEQRIQSALTAVRLARPLDTKPVGQLVSDLTLVEDSAVEQDMMASRLGQAIADRAGWEYTDLCSRLNVLEAGGPNSLDPAGDVLRPQVLARWLIDSWTDAGLGAAHWMTLQTVLHDEATHLAQEGYHDANHVLLDHGVKPEIDLRPFIRRTKDTGVGPAIQRSAAPYVSGSAGIGGALSNNAPGGPRSGPGTAPMPHSSMGGPSQMGGNSGLQPMGGAHEETRLMTQTPALRRSAVPAQAVLGKLNQFVSNKVPGFVPTQVLGGGANVVVGVVAPALGQAIQDAGQVVRRHVDADSGIPTGTPAALLQDLQESKRALKQAASTPNERAIIEIVALLFQSILTEERLPAAIRVWFARLQMPVLRVAVTEPDFFATIDHPARALIDRMGACVMGFAATPREQEDALPGEIKRIVQVVEAYPDTGRRVFQTVLVEFEKFLERYFRDENESSRKGVSLAQQVEQRETWAIQYTIELRKMLADVPVHEGVREFLFRVWADVLAHSAVQTSPSSEETRVLKRAAADLIWSASAKHSREDRADVLRRLPPLLKKVRDGMARAGMAVEKQDEHVHELNAALAAAFSARSATISSAHLKEVTERLEALDDILPNLAEVELDAQTLRDLSGHESSDLEVVAEGGTMPTPAMMAWARELQIGAWFQLDYRGSQESVQFAWSGLQKQLALFVTPQGRGVLFQLHRLAAFLQAGLLVPVEDESLTVRATREALAKLDADPERLLN
ncbi:DUF1631 family protein [Aquabacterium sp. CECT 9606]|uniref:DUF1631 family protein n=1 Tax=Aquabacterium sp. CECT 9606 TaxID=2845822 RepID=UPI001E557E0B|nr:DUF1631 family protein [Aquabacterium sp. CECT 9606]CAH0347842.1 hypothetical protein AQB9606_00061 [Aquabacterium sp. CECT 9606]